MPLPEARYPDPALQGAILAEWLAGVGYVQLEDLTRETERQINQSHGIGLKALATLRNALAVQGMSFVKKQVPEGSETPQAR